MAERASQAVLPRIANWLVGETSRSWYAIGVPPRLGSPACTSIRKYSTCSYSRWYFGPFAGCADRRELVKGFAATERNPDQIVAVAPQTPHLPDSVTGAVGRRGIRQARRRSAGCATTWGGLRRVTTVPHAKFFWPEEHPRLLTVLLKEFWASAN